MRNAAIIQLFAEYSHLKPLHPTDFFVSSFLIAFWSAIHLWFRSQYKYLLGFYCDSYKNIHLSRNSLIDFSLHHIYQWSQNYFRTNFSRAFDCRFYQKKVNICFPFLFLVFTKYNHSYFACSGHGNINEPCLKNMYRNIRANRMLINESVVISSSRSQNMMILHPILPIFDSKSTPIHRISRVCSLNLNDIRCDRRANWPQSILLRSSIYEQSVASEIGSILLGYSTIKMECLFFSLLIIFVHTVRHTLKFNENERKKTNPSKIKLNFNLFGWCSKMNNVTVG